MDISIYDNYSGAAQEFEFLRMDGEYKMYDSLIAIICMRGRAVFRIKLQDYEIRRGAYLIIGANAPFYILEKSEDFRIDVVQAGDSIFDLSYDEVLKKRLEKLIIQRPTNSLSNKKLMMFHIIHSYLKVMIKEQQNFYRDMILFEYIKIFLYEACHIMDDTVSEGTPKAKERNITNRFFQLIEEKYKDDRKVENYAEQIGITPKHLAFVIKKATGKYPSEWLDNYVLLESKRMLRNTDLSIQEISYCLNFSTPSHFGKFFKSRSGLTPKKFRDRILNIG